MKILLILSAMLWTCYLCGKFVAVFIAPKNDLRPVVLQIGYAYVLVFFYGFYAALHSALAATCVTLMTPVALWCMRLIQRHHRPADHVSQGARSYVVTRGRNGFYFVAGSVLVTTIAIWPHMLAGWGNYWHSGNQDMEDGLNGRDAYLEKKIFDSQYDLGKLIGDRSWYDFGKVTGTLPKHAHEANSYREWYAGDGFRFQYSSLAFWSIVFNERFGIDILLEQAALDLLLMFSGIYFLCRRAFSMSGPVAAISGATSVLSTFYLTTYYAGHIGSLMYGALAPGVLVLVLARRPDGLSTRAVFVFTALIVTAIGFSYPHPLAILAPPVILYKLSAEKQFRESLNRVWRTVTRDKRRVVLGAVVVVVALLLIILFLWQFTASYRLRQADQYRAWGYTHDWLILPLFLGLISSPMAGMPFIGATLSSSTYWVLIICSAVACVILGVCYCRFRPVANHLFFTWFGVFWLLSYLVFRFFIVDSYYLYKFLYTQQFMVVVGVAGFLAVRRNRIFYTLVTGIVLLNVASDVQAARAIYQRPYNHESEDLARLVKVDRPMLEGAFVDISGGEGTAVRQFLKAHSIETSLDPRFARYFIVPADRESDITGAQLSETVVRAGRLAIKRAPARNYLMVRTWFDPEWGYADPVVGKRVFRWVGSGRNDHVGIYVVRPDGYLAAEKRYLRICLASGPSAIGNVPITISAADTEIYARIDLSGIRCVWIPSAKVVSAKQPVLIRSGVRGKRLLPYDDRILLYRVFAVEWTQDVYDNSVSSLFNADGDIGTCTQRDGLATEPSRPSVCLGQGWQSLERYEGARFRWAGKCAEIIVQGGSKSGSVKLAVTLEVGPSHGPGPLRLSVRERDGPAIYAQREVSGRETVTLDLSHPDGLRGIYVLEADGQNLPVPNDPRILTYRVFKIAAQ